MISVFYRVGLYVSSFFPLYILLVVNNYTSLSSWEKIKKILAFENATGSAFWFMLLGLMMFSIMSLSIITNVSLSEKHEFDGISKTEDNLLDYVVTYLVPLLSIDITKLNSLLVNAGLFLLLGFIYVKNNFVYLNPLFLFFGYNIFKTSKEEIIISNFDIYDLKNMEKQRLKCRVLGYKIFLVRRQGQDS
ncbi:hypothetical protein P4H66_23525 [Paenibacillus dokdonensis]|uniref:Uncharacterized protein n=1 Tax=Paenibacillus dokdonensis TaxID=2567944 RepID=A0ABU6GWM6_9BACL|nr:hypothetical protein [Paenibacillus dokdonensis]MEC0242786.1 hypothetical protein [Paenibacillus dokdonensis]